MLSNYESEALYKQVDLSLRSLRNRQQLSNSLFVQEARKVNDKYTNHNNKGTLGSWLNDKRAESKRMA